MNDEAAFRTLIVSFSNRMYHFAMTIVDNEQDAEEILSDVFLKIWQLRRQLPPAEQFVYYLYTAVKNTALNYVKKRQNKLRAENIFRLRAAKLQSTGGLDILISRENMVQIQQAINQLPPQCRQIFLLVKEDNLSYKQVAELLEISPATVNTQMTIALKKIWSLLPSAVKMQHS